MLSDAELMELLVPTPRDEFDFPLRGGAERAERDGWHLSAFTIPWLASPSEPAPQIIVAHRERHPPIETVRAAYLRMVRRCRPKKRRAA